MYEVTEGKGLEQQQQDESGQIVEVTSKALANPSWFILTWHHPPSTEPC